MSQRPNDLHEELAQHLEAIDQQPNAEYEMTLGHLHDDSAVQCWQRGEPCADDCDCERHEFRSSREIRAYHDGRVVEISKLVDAVDAIDSWLSRGGFLPLAWVENRPTLEIAR